MDGKVDLNNNNNNNPTLPESLPKKAIKSIL